MLKFKFGNKEEIVLKYELFKKNFSLFLFYFLNLAFYFVIGKNFN